MEIPEIKICSELTIKTSVRCHYRRSSAFIVNSEKIWHIASSVFTADFEQKMPTEYFAYTLYFHKYKVFIKDFFSKCDHIRRNLRIWSHFLKKSLMENFIFCAVDITTSPWTQNVNLTYLEGVGLSTKTKMNTEN